MPFKLSSFPLLLFGVSSYLLISSIFCSSSSYFWRPFFCFIDFLYVTYKKRLKGRGVKIECIVCHICNGMWLPDYMLHIYWLLTYTSIYIHVYTLLYMLLYVNKGWKRRKRNNFLFLFPFQLFVLTMNYTCKRRIWLPYNR